VRGRPQSEATSHGPATWFSFWRSSDNLVTSSTQDTDRAKVDSFMASVADLSNLPLFNGLDDDQLGELATWFHLESQAGGTRLVGEGAPGYTFFILTDGTAAVTSEGQSLATLGPGDFFGEIAILGDGRRSATVTSTSPVRVLVMFGTEFRRLEAAHPEIASRIAEAMQVRVAGRVSEPA
jgi:CRP-like cAMP-binding protein